MSANVYNRARSIMCLMSKTEQFEFRTIKFSYKDIFQRLLCVKEKHLCMKVCVYVKASACKSVCV